MSTKLITIITAPINNSDATNKLYVDTTITTAVSGYLPLVGGTMSGNIDMSTKLITIITAPINNSDATNKLYVDTADNLKLALTGGTMSGAINMGSNKITSLGTPTLSTDATTKSYVDTADNLKLDKTGGTISSSLLCQTFVTIGTTAVNVYPLEITANTSASFTSGYAMTSGGVAVVVPTLTAGVSLKTTNTIWSQTRVIVSSDPRIKTGFEELEIKDSLEIINRITPFRYTMIETSKIDLGFSAKQVLSLVPEAVDIHENKIPSMMEMIDVKNQVIRTKKRIEAHENDTVVFYKDDREIRVKIIKKMSKNYIRVDLPDGEYLFYGHVVPDFLTLDYKQINIHLMNVVKNLVQRIEKLEMIVNKFL